MYVYSRSSITETEEGCFLKKFCLLAKTKFEGALIRQIKLLQ